MENAEKLNQGKARYGDEELRPLANAFPNALVRFHFVDMVLQASCPHY